MARRPILRPLPPRNSVRFEVAERIFANARPQVERRFAEHEIARLAREHALSGIAEERFALLYRPLAFPIDKFHPPLCLRLCAERGHSRKLPAFHPFEKGTAGGGDVSKVPCHARVVQGGHGVPSPGDGDQRTFARERGGGFRKRNGATVERRRLKSAERTVPNQCSADGG